MADIDELNAQAQVFTAALEVYERRDEVHKGLWKNDLPYELAGQALHKVKRVDFHCHPAQENPKQAIEDAVDAINYLAFVIRQLGGTFVLVEGDLNGS
jgi:hypothetical protein